MGFADTTAPLATTGNGSLHPTPPDTCTATPLPIVGPPRTPLTYRKENTMGEPKRRPKDGQLCLVPGCEDLAEFTHAEAASPRLTAMLRPPKEED